MLGYRFAFISYYFLLLLSITIMKLSSGVRQVVWLLQYPCNLFSRDLWFLYFERFFTRLRDWPCAQPHSGGPVFSFGLFMRLFITVSTSWQFASYFCSNKITDLLIKFINCFTTMVLMYFYY